MVKRPYIGPCQDPLRLWFLEWEDRRGIWRRYFANRDEARAGLRAFREAAGMRRRRRRVVSNVDQPQRSQRVKTSSVLSGDWKMR